MNKNQIWVLIIMLVGTCLIVPFSIAYWLEGSMSIIGWAGLVIASYLFYSDGYDHFINRKVEK